MLGLRPAALTACGRIFVEEIARWQEQTAKARGIEDGETGAVTFAQRFNGTPGSFVHFHVVVADGVFTRADDTGEIGLAGIRVPTVLLALGALATMQVRRRPARTNRST
ncbi:hypothetical protein [Sorangium sp. So ce1151]|uniref:hypothetical protein n=1 Tax=Sorangium sp. So ce1151 TaxID=3133332 RepID=UPI003F6417CE